MKILGVKIDNLGKDEILLKVEEFLRGGKSRYIVTPNPEFLVEARKDREFRDILNRADLSVADGVGLVWAARRLGCPLKGHLAGVDLMEAICAQAAEKNWPVFLLGGRNGVAERAAAKLREKHSGLEVQIFRFAQNGMTAKRPGTLFVALGAPKQEKWIAANLSKMPAIKLAVGVGGAFDYLSGRIRRAPEFVRRVGLEWLWRFFRQPWRFRRIFRAAVVFPWLVLRSAKKR